MPDGWVAARGLQAMPASEQYLETVQWALARMPPSRTTDNMLLNTQAERVTALLATGSAMLIGSIFTSILTNEISDIRRVHRARSEARQQIEDFLRTFPVPWELESCLREYLHRNTQIAFAPSKQDIAKLLPEHLYRELCREALAPVLSMHQLFGNMVTKFTALQYDLCHKALLDRHVSPHETLFSAGPTCENMLIVASGSIWYRSMQGYSMDTTSKPLTATSFRRRSWASILPTDGRSPLSAVQLIACDWICEACLWCSWSYLGKAMCEMPASLLCLSQQALLELMSTHKEVRTQVFMYARNFVKSLNNMDSDTLSDLPIEVEGVSHLLDLSRPR